MARTRAWPLQPRYSRTRTAPGSPGGCLQKIQSSFTHSFLFSRTSVLTGWAFYSGILPKLTRDIIHWDFALHFSSIFGSIKLFPFGISSHGPPQRNCFYLRSTWQADWGRVYSPPRRYTSRWHRSLVSTPQCKWKPEMTHDATLYFWKKALKCLCFPSIFCGGFYISLLYSGG